MKKKSFGSLVKKKISLSLEIISLKDIGEVWELYGKKILRLSGSSWWVDGRGFLGGGRLK